MLETALKTHRGVRERKQEVIASINANTKIRTVAAEVALLPKLESIFKSK